MNLTLPTNTRDLPTFLPQLAQRVVTEDAHMREIIYNYVVLLNLPPMPCLFIAGELKGRPAELYLLLFTEGKIKFQAMFNNDDAGISALELFPDLPSVDLSPGTGFYKGEITPNPSVLQFCMVKGIEL